MWGVQAASGGAGEPERAAAPRPARVDDVNKVVLQGIVEGVPQVRKFENGGTRVNLNVKTVTVEPEEDGSSRERPAWHRIAVGGRMNAETAESLVEGNLVYVEGEFRTREYQNQDDQRVFWPEIRADVVRSVAGRAAINTAIVLGAVTRVDELRSFENGQVLNFTVRTTNHWTARDGEEKEEVQWHRIAAWGALADQLNGRLGKGQRALVKGRARTTSWTDGAGVQQRRFEIQAKTVVPLGEPSGSAAEASAGGDRRPEDSPPAPGGRAKEWGQQFDRQAGAPSSGVDTSPDDDDPPF